MISIDRLSLGINRKLPILYQTEAAECGTVCLSMIAAYHGLHLDVRAVRAMFPVSLKGASLSNLVKIAKRVGLETRAVRLELNELRQLRMPSILHWNFNHFVVLKDAGRDEIVIHDPARGERKIPLAEVSNAFTGVALELWPGPAFVEDEVRPRLKLRALIGSVTGLKRSLAQVLVLAFTLEILSVVSPLFLQWTVDGVVVNADHDLLMTLLIGFGLVLIIQQLIGGIRSWVMMHLSTTIGVQWKASVFGHLLKLPLAFFEKRHVGEVMSRFGSVDSIQQTLTTSFLAAVLDGVMAIVTLAMMFVYSPILGSVAVVTMLLYGCGRAIWYRPLREATEDAIVQSAQTQSHFLETLRGIRAIQLYQRQDERQLTWLAMLIGQVNANLKTQKLQLIYQQWNGLLFGIESIIGLWLGAKFVMEGYFSVGMLMSFMAYKGQFSGRASRLIDNYFSLKMLHLQGERLADIVLTAPEVDDCSSFGPDNNILGNIDISGVQYRYAHGEPTILRYIDLKICAGESIAIVGPTGCGKTTLINVMLGILSPTRGTVRVDGMDLSSVGYRAFREVVGTVMQDDVLFAGSIADNIGFFDPHLDQAWVMECATIASIHEEIVAMPMGYHTLVGDMGTVLSGGQKQRILLARALYRRPKILFLDEATCHLDVEREKALVQAIGALKITRIIVAHRPQTIAAADRVVVLSGGVITKDCSSKDFTLAEEYGNQGHELSRQFFTTA